MLAADELVGFHPARLQNEDDVDAWHEIAPSALVNVADRLRSEGFIAAMREDLAADENDRGALSIVVHLRDRRAARHELASQRHDYATQGTRLHGHTYTPFTVEEIPGAYGFTSSDPSGGRGINVIFAAGAFTYHVGAGWGDGANDPPSRAAVVRAARHLYARVIGR